MILGERILRALSRDPRAVQQERSESAGTEDPFALFAANFPGFHERLIGKSVLDFGCGTGRMTLSLAESGAHRVVGLDINPRWLRIARARDVSHLPPDRVAFVDRLDTRFHRAFDIVVSRDSMEHFSDPAACLEAMRLCCRPGGAIFMTFGPPWYAPYGSHMRFFTPLPWVNLLFSEKTVMAVRAGYRSDGARRYEEVESGLNRMSIARFERLVAQSGLRLDACQYHSVKGLPWIHRLPLVRELFVNEVACVLSPSSPEPAAARPDPNQETAAFPPVRQRLPDSA